MNSDVYFIEVKSRNIEQRCSALLKLLEYARPFSSYKKDEIIPVKLTIGDSACIYHLHPKLVSAVVGVIKKERAKPFLFDTNVIYKGQRLNAVDHLALAQAKGFGYASTGAPFLIADGLLGQDGREFELDSVFIRKIRVPSFVGMLESLVVLSHVTGHILVGYAGAIKNVAMGMSSRATKQVQHSSLKPSVLPGQCTGCGCCLKACPVCAISQESAIARIDQDICLGCGECLTACKFYAIKVNWQEDAGIFAKRIAEVAAFIASQFKNKFFINFAWDITRECDCLSTKDEKTIAENLGILASADMLSLDRATLDLASRSGCGRHLGKANTVFNSMLEYACQKKAGNPGYNLIKLKC